MNYLIIGDDEYMREAEAGRIRDKFLSSGEVELNYSAHRPDDIEGIMDSLGTMPFLAERRVVLVKDAHGLSDGAAETVLSYLTDPSGTSVLVLSSDGSFKKKKKKYYGRLSGLVDIIPADKPTPSTIKKWIRNFFKKEGVEITPGAVDLIVELRGSDAAGVRAELEKLVCFSGGESIEAAHVEQLVGRSVKDDVFKLVDAVNTRDAGWAFRVLRDLCDRKKQPHEIIGYLSWYTRIMQKIALLSGRGIGPEGISAELGYNPGYTRRLVGQSKKYPVSRITRWVSLLLEADREIKKGLKPPQLALEMLLVNLLNS